MRRCCHDAPVRDVSLQRAIDLAREHAARTEPEHAGRVGRRAAAGRGRDGPRRPALRGRLRHGRLRRAGGRHPCITSARCSAVRRSSRRHASSALTTGRFRARRASSRRARPRTSGRAGDGSRRDPLGLLQLRHGQPDELLCLRHRACGSPVRSGRVGERVVERDRSSRPLRAQRRTASAWRAIAACDTTPSRPGAARCRRVQNTARGLEVQSPRGAGAADRRRPGP
jgi:hypothetical protein